VQGRLYVYHTTKTAKKNKKEGDITLHHIDIMVMCSRVISPSFYYILCEDNVNLQGTEIYCVAMRTACYLRKCSLFSTGHWT